MNIIDYLLLSKKMIDDQETFAYNSWLLKFIKSSAGFSLYEATPNGDGFNNGVDYGVVITSDQNHECKKLKIAPLFPTFSQDIVISKGIYEGLPVNAVRYPSPGHMTGWWLTTDLYDGKIESLMNVHFYHVAFKRPDILRFLALPHGFRFYSDTNSQEVWFDPTVLNEN
jgi:hypothetical protein